MSSLTNATGQITIFGLDGTTIEWSGQAAARHVLNSIDHQDMADVASAQDAAGDTFAEGITDHNQMMTVEYLVKDNAGSPTRAQAAAAFTYPSMGVKVTLAGWGNTLIDGDYNYLGGARISRSNKTHAKVTLPLKRYIRSGNPTAFTPAT